MPLSPPGVLTVAKPLDREDVHHFVLNVSVSDHGRVPLSTFQVLHVYVQDVNDSPPRFLRERYLSNVSESAPVGTSVLTVHATDKDLGEMLRRVFGRRKKTASGL